MRKPSPSSAPARASHRVRPDSMARVAAYAARDRHQCQQRVGVVEAEHQRGDRGKGHDRPGDERGRWPEPAAHGGVEHADRGHARQGLRHQQAPVVHPEDAGRTAPYPQEGRGLVHGDEVGRVQRAEEERLPALRPGLGGSGIELVGPAVTAQADEIEQGGGHEQGQQRRPGPRRVARAAAQHRATPPRAGRMTRGGPAGPGCVERAAMTPIRVVQQPGLSDRGSFRVCGPGGGMPGGGSARPLAAEHPARGRARTGPRWRPGWPR